MITSAIPYINGVKHLGNLIGSLLPSDLYARYLRLCGHEVLLICATDEHGTPAELAASKAGKPVEKYCEEMHATQKKLNDGFRLSFDYFGRSSSNRNRNLTQHFAARLADNGYISEVEEEQIYSQADGRFLPDRYIEGECPECGYERARGDQCENCTKQLEPKDLINPRSAVSGSTDLEVRKTKHLYLRQSMFRDRLVEWIDSKTDWPVLTTSIAKKWLFDGEGLQDRGITRDLDWGVPVRRGSEPWPGMEGKVFYVWFDAPIEYIAATAEWADANGYSDAEWERWWRTRKGAHDVRYVQFMGKDNVPFHTLSFPATILGSEEDWKRVDYIKSFNYLNYDGGQFSTSLGRGIFMDQALEILPPDYWRWWLLSHAPEYSDSEFTWWDFVDSVNKDLADVLGNYASRTTKFCATRFESAVPTTLDGRHAKILEKLREEEGLEFAMPTSFEYEFAEDLARNLKKRIQAYVGFMDAMEVRKSAKELRAIWAVGNEFIQSEAPWSTICDDPKRAAAVIAIALNLLRIFAVLSEPFIPDASIAIMSALNTEDRKWPIKKKKVKLKYVRGALLKLEPGHKISVIDNLFKKISDDERDEWRERFAGDADA